MSIDDRIQEVEGVITDCDGILTDGRVYFTGEGEQIKSFHVHDGAAVKMLQHAGIRVALISGRDSPPLAVRAEELDFDAFYPGSSDKREPFGAICEKWEISPRQICYIGDDLTDIGPVRQAGFVATVPGAADEIQGEADYVTETRGGYGAFREIAERILKTKGLWSSVQDMY